MRSANNGMQNTIRIATSLLYSSRLYFALPLPLPYFYSTSASKSTPAPTPLLYSTLLCSTLLYSTSIYSTSTLPLLYLYLTLPLLSSSLLYLHSTSALPLLYLFSTSRRCQLDTMIFGPARMWVNDLLMQVPAGHNDLWASENVKVRNSEFPPWNFLW